MLFQSRPFFRQKIKLHNINNTSTQVMYRNHNMFNKNIRLNKLSPHKFKRINTFKSTIFTPISSYKYSNFFKVIYIQLSPFNTPISMFYKNNLGVIFQFTTLKGC